MSDRIEAARARIAASREASNTWDVAPRDWYDLRPGSRLLHWFPPADAEHIAFHSPAAVEALRADLDAALAVVEAVQAWASDYEKYQHCDHDTLDAAMAAFEDGGDNAKS